MGQLAIYLPPFAGDYTGVCSALFDLNCLIIINDASCCTRNYVSYDEPRWTVTKKTTLCSELRTIDAILGDDEKVINQAVEMGSKLKSDFIVVLGSPVPAIIGMDMKGIAQEIEVRSGCPALGFDTTGFSYYDKGVAAAFLMLLKRFTLLQTKTAANTVNILGLTPLDFSANNNSKMMREWLEANEMQVICSFLMETNLEQVRLASSAAVNLVVSHSGWLAAQYMHERFGIPYVVATPIGLNYSNEVMGALQSAARDKVSRIINGQSLQGSLAQEQDMPSILIIGDQVMANSLRAALQHAGCKQKITVASFFDFTQSWHCPMIFS